MAVRIVTLHPALSGYMAACLRALKVRHDVSLVSFFEPPDEMAPFDVGQFAFIDELRDRRAMSWQELGQRIEAFEPHGVYLPGWQVPDYLKALRSLPDRRFPVIAGLDGQWRGTVRQRIGARLAPFHLHPVIDAIWVPGDRQAEFAHRLGYRGDRCLHGLYACDHDLFGGRRPASETLQSRFLFVGRYVEAKGLPDLLEAYQRYRGSVAEPWELLCAGTGPLKNMLRDQAGVTDLGFVQPHELPAVFAEAGAFVLPSRSEPWGVVVQEAALCGLPLICTRSCGAAVHLLQDRYNGFLCAAGDVPHLSRCLTRMAAVSAEERVEYGLRSIGLARQFTPRRWADTLMHAVDRFGAA